MQGPQGQSGAQGVPGPQGLQGATGGEGPGASTFTLTLDEGSTAGTVLATTSGVTISARCGNAGQPAIDLSGPTSTDFVHFVGGDIEKDNFGGSGAIEFTNLLTHEFNLNDGDGVLWDGLVRIEGNGSKYSRIDVSGNGGSGNPCTFQGMIIPSG